MPLTAKPGAYRPVFAEGAAAGADVAVKTGHLMAGFEEAPGEGAADKAADAGNEDAHVGSGKQRPGDR